MSSVCHAKSFITYNLRQLITAAMSPLTLSIMADCSYIAYALYFDHRRRSDPEFRKALKRDSRREARAAKEEADAQGAQQRQAIEVAVREARDEGFPTDVSEKEGYFMNEVSQGEVLCQDGRSSVGLWMRLRLLRPASREQTNRRSTLLLQGTQGLSSTTRPDPYLRQDCAKAGHRHTSGDDCFGSDHQRWSLWWRGLWLRTWFFDWD